MTRILTVTILMLLPLCSFTQDIDSLILKNEYDKALQLIDSELVINNTQPKYFIRKGSVLIKKYDYTNALKSFESAYLLDSANSVVLNELAEVHTNLGNYRQALPYYQMIYDRDTLNTVNAIKLARAWFNLRSYGEPLKILESLYYRDSTNAYINKQYAYSAYRTGHDTLAIALYIKVISKNPTDINNYINLTTLYQKREMYEKAVETLENGLLVFPGESMLLNKLGDIHYAKRVYSKAVVPYEKLLAAGDSIPDVMKNLGIGYYYEKRYREGLFLLEKYLTIKPNDPVAGLFIGLCYKELNDIDESIGYLNFASRIAIPYYMSDIYNQLGNNYIQKKDYRKSVEFLKKAYRLDSAKCEILFKIANTYDVWQKDKSQALRYYHAYLKAKKEKSDFYRQLTDYSVERIRKLTN